MKRLTIADNSYGIETFPFRILIVVIVLTILVPVAVYGFRHYTGIQRETELRAEVIRITNLVVLVYNQAVNSALCLKLNLPDGTEYIKIGGKLGTGSQWLIRYKIVGGGEQRVVVREGDNAIPMTSDRNEALRLGGVGMTTIRAQKLVSTTDIDGDGIVTDYYVEVSIVK